MQLRPVDPVLFRPLTQAHLWQGQEGELHAGRCFHPVNSPPGSDNAVASTPGSSIAGHPEGSSQRDLAPVDPATDHVKNAQAAPLVGINGAEDEVVGARNQFL